MFGDFLSNIRPTNRPTTVRKTAKKPSKHLPDSPTEKPEIANDIREQDTDRRDIRKTDKMSRKNDRSSENKQKTKT